MGSVLVYSPEESVTVSAQALRRLLEKGDGDAALLYLALLRHHGTIQPRALAGELRWERPRIEAAEEALRQLGLIAPAEQPPAPAEESPAYQRSDILERLESGGEFRSLVAEVERKLGKKLTVPDIGILLGLQDYLGLPGDVIYLLVCHCAERIQRRYGPGRRPAMRQIEKEGYYWARQGLFDQDSAARYLKTWRDRQQGQSAYMQVLGLGQRRPVASEEKYISDWMDKGFPPETVALAYDKTIFYKKQLEWRYLNGILRRWHENGWHTPEEVQQGDAGKPAQPSPKPDKPDQDNSRMEKYMKW